MSDIMSELTSHQMSHPTETSAGLPRPGGEAYHDRLLRSDWDCISYQISFKDLDEDICLLGLFEHGLPKNLIVWISVSSSTW